MGAWVGGRVSVEHYSCNLQLQFTGKPCNVKLLSNQIPIKQLEVMVHDFKGLCTVGYCHMAI